MPPENLIEKAQTQTNSDSAAKKASEQGKSAGAPVAGEDEFKEENKPAAEITSSAQVSQNAADADRNKRDRTVLNSVQESLTKIAEELRTAAAKLAGNVDQTTLDRLNVVQQQLESIK